PASCALNMAPAESHSDHLIARSAWFLASYLRQGAPVTEERKRPRPDDYFADWKQREALAESMIPVVGQISR
ncbi:MAG: glyceraldehyde-3-phosphate dehydrogenase, partial [Halieaceae bacterium]